MRLKPHLIGLLCALLVAGTFSGLPAQEPVEGTPLALAPVGVSVRGSHLLSDLFTTTAVWIEQASGGTQQLKILTVKDGVLPPARFLQPRTLGSAGAGAELSDPDLAINPITSQPGVVWVRADGTYSLMFSEMSGATETITKTENLLEMPALAYDGSGRVFAAWSEVSGGRSRIVGAVRNGEDLWIPFALSHGERPYEVLPQVFPMAAGAEVYWFSINGNEFSNHYAVAGGDGTVAFASISLGTIPANRLPILYHVGQDRQLGAYWLEQWAGGEAYMNMDPRAESGTPVVIGDPANSPEQACVSDDGSGTAVWLESGEPGERRLLVSNPASGARSLVVSRQAGEPSVSTSVNWTHLLWTDPQSAHGNGVLWYMRFR